MNSSLDQQSMNGRKLRVLIVSTRGAHQKAIQVLCVSAPEIGSIDTSANIPQAFEMIKEDPPNLVILGANLSVSQVCEFLSQIETMPNSPYCIALTVSEFGNCFDKQISADRIIPTTTFAHRLPEILAQVPVQ